MNNKFTNYFYNSWIQTTGEGWTRNQVLYAYIFSIVFAIAVIAYSFWAKLNWNGIQIFAATWLAWDLGGGVIGYSHKAIKARNKKENSKLHFFHHNLLHIHPLIIIFFHNHNLLLGITIFSIISFFTYVEILEISPKTGKRKLSINGEKVFITFQVLIAISLIVLSFVVNEISNNYQYFGIITYGALILTTFIIIVSRVENQQIFSVMLVLVMILIGMFLDIPKGFEWLIPVYFLKLLVGYTARD